MLNWARKSIAKFFGGLFFTILTLFPSGAAALDPGVYESLTTPFYAPSDSASCASGSVTSSQLPADVVAAINNLKPDYEAAAATVSVPWQLLAAVHYRENGNSPSGDLQAGNPIDGPYARASTAYAKYGYPKSMAESAEIAAKMLVDISQDGVVKKPINIPNPDPEAIKDTLFSYNGRASAYADQAATLGFNRDTQPYEGSPYVMNNFDAKHKNMKIITRDNGPVDAVDARFGAFTIYSLLGGAAGSGCAVLGDAVQTAIKYSWPEHHQADYLKLKPEYQVAIQRAVSKHEYVGGGAHPGVDCGAFVTRVMRDSGADPSYNQANGDTIAQKDYMDAHPEKYQKLQGVSGTNNLQPGDIAINSSHAYMYVGNQDDFKGDAASASFGGTGGGWRAPMASNTYGFSEFNWYRLVQ